MTVKKFEIFSGPSIIKKYFTLYTDSGEEIGSLADGHMFEIGGLCSGGYICRKYASKLEIYPTMYDAVTKGLGVVGTLDEIDEVCSLFFKEGYRL